MVLEPLTKTLVQAFKPWRTLEDLRPGGPCPPYSQPYYNAITTLFAAGKSGSGAPNENFGSSFQALEDPGGLEAWRTLPPLFTTLLQRYYNPIRGG